jgi:hypothetical protein
LITNSNSIDKDSLFYSVVCIIIKEINYGKWNNIIFR